MTYSGLTEYETIPVDETTRVVVYYDDDYQMEAEERELTPEQIEEEQAQLDQDGVYIVAVEKLQTWALLASDGSHTGATREEWYQEDMIGGCFLDVDYKAVQVAREFFPEHFNL